MKILITGGAGFIGSHVADTYVQAGHQVVIIDDLSTGKADYVPAAAKFIQADIKNQTLISDIIGREKPDVINHHAAHIQVGYSVKNPQFDAQTNIIGLLNIMEAAKNTSVKKVIMASTGGAMYGNQPTPFDESMAALPLSPYGISKRSSELYLNYYHELYGIPYIALRYSNVYGPRQNPHGESGVVAIFSEMIVQGKAPVINGAGDHTRDYVYVGDVAQANLRALTCDYVGEINIGTATEISANQVYEMVSSALGFNQPASHGPERPGEQVTSSLSYQKAQQILGWQPTVDFASGVQKVADWYRHAA